jgi:hypothetical protein
MPSRLLPVSEAGGIPANLIQADRGEKPMPNGGTDNCGTCCFNARNQGEAGWAHASLFQRLLHREPPNVCQIRKLSVNEAPFYTYCANHPNQTGGRRVLIPVGPVFMWEERRLWVKSPDTEEVRVHLLACLSAIEETPPPAYPAGATFDDTVIWQLGVFGEARALRGLERVACFDPTLTGNGPFTRDQAGTIALAGQALAQILPPEAIKPAWRTWNDGAVLKLAQVLADEGRFADLPVLADALEEAGCSDSRILHHCRETGPHAPRCRVLEVLLDTDATAAQ